MRLDVISEGEPCPELQNTWVASAGDESELVGGNVSIRILKLSMVEQVERLEPQFEATSFSDFCDLSQCQVPIVEPRPVEKAAA